MLILFTKGILKNIKYTERLRVKEQEIFQANTKRK